MGGWKKEGMRGLGDWVGGVVVEREMGGLVDRDRWGALDERDLGGW